MDNQATYFSQQPDICMLIDSMLSFRYWHRPSCEEIVNHLNTRSSVRDHPGDSHGIPETDDRPLTILELG